MSVEAQIYDFENVFSAAFQSVLDGVDLKTLSIVDAPEQTSERPRCEVNVYPGAGLGGIFPESGRSANPGDCRENTFAASAEIGIITPPLKELHIAYRARVRNVCARMRPRVNTDEVLPYHRISFFKTAGTQHFYDADKGYWLTQLKFDFAFCITKNAWADLAAENP